ncbi:cob(I)yrinic acid a,c-diamide adenosyltransferase [Kineothrix sp. MB12-C1]|uniref:cob(I)yrinic acid a,c-diamide adenosyltransferase n=1 Tax=Kineothrix sp. MB12-C1 TaxID=3070215 RepID=UPI0027D2F845|nr:cob(I)yrinic acid a,c-diamide adenosyltransferase [Kineothrix sp. MB12-C1]WMC93535.1 cob(I)yrinic acid a,c-diamide adenosyltransferase [Kineothrix sp. MB12-C1]
MKKGLIHVYCGDGKGKTTASVGLALRAAGNGKRVIFSQFMKGNDSGELFAMEKIEGIQIIRNTKNYGFYKDMSEEDKEEITKEHNEMLEKLLQAAMDEVCDMLILDEVTYPYDLDLIDKKKLRRLVEGKPESLELIITGRNPDGVFLQNADYITEMKAVRHPYEKGIPARRGVEY